MDILPSLPVDAATIRALWGISRWAVEIAKEWKDFPHMDQLREVEKTFTADKAGQSAEAATADKKDSK